MRDIATTLVSSAIALLSFSAASDAFVIPEIGKNGLLSIPSIIVRRGQSMAHDVYPRMDNASTILGHSNSGTNSTRPKGGKRLCTKPRVRREWRRLSNKEKLDYIDAVKCMRSIPPKTKSVWPGVHSRYDDFVGLHINVTNSSVPIHNNGLFLPWHRTLVWIWEETIIKECGYKGAQPFWDYYLDGPAYDRHLNMSPVWDSVYGFGGNGVINQTAANQNQPVNPWGDEVKPPGFNPWGDEPVHPPKDPGKAQADKPTSQEAQEDPWGTPVHPPKQSTTSNSPSPGAVAAPSPNPPGSFPSPTVVPFGSQNAASDASGSAANNSLGAPIFEDGEGPSDEGWTRVPHIDRHGWFQDIDQRKAIHGRSLRRFHKRQQITAKKGKAGLGQTPLTFGGPAWPFIQFLPMLPPFLLDGLLRPDGDDDDDDAAPAAATATPRRTMGCVKDGPFADALVYLGPGESVASNPRCLQRGFNFDIAESALTPEKMEEVMSKDNFARFSELDFETNLNMGPHTVGHRGIGGDMFNLYSSTNDPIFFLHHAFIDRLWTLWQGRNSSRLWDADATYQGLPPPAPGTVHPTGRTTLDSPLWFGIMGQETKISSVMDTLNREEDETNRFCYTYDDAEWPVD